MAFTLFAMAGLVAMVLFVLVAPREGAVWWLTIIAIPSTAAAVMAFLGGELGWFLGAGVLAALCWEAVRRLEGGRKS